MSQSRRAFTLIELLVVIAIIAILAAILFPVFAQAKAAAKQSACLSNTKQLNLGIIQYTTDVDDLYPAGRPYVFGGWNLGYHGWDFPCFADQGNTDCLMWGNSTYPYIKNQGVFNCPTAPVANPYGYGSDRNPTASTFNGTLQFSSSTSVSSPAVTVLLWSGFKANAVKGRTWSNPSPDCGDNTPGTSCVYVPNLDGNATGNGSRDEIYTDGAFEARNNKWMHGHGDNFSYTDGHSKWKPMNGGVTTDPWTSTSPTGDLAGTSVWKYTAPNGQRTHTCLFSPDNPCGL